MSDGPIFLAEFATRSLPVGLSIRLRTVLVSRASGPEPEPQTGPELEFLISAEQATDFAHAILEAVKDWKKEHQH